MRSTSPSTLSAEDLSAIRSIAEDQWTAAAVARDWERTMGLCADDVVYMPPDQPALLGRAALRAWLDQFPPILAFTQPVEAIDGREDVAVVRAAFEVTIDVRGTTVSSSGKALCALQRTAQGAWLVKTVCFNWDRPMTAT